MSDSDDSQTATMSDSDDSYDSGPDELQLFRQTFVESLEIIKSVGTFATGGVLTTPLTPGIRVDGEIITLPLLLEEAQKLASRSVQASPGETLVDESVGKTLEIGADRIDFQNDEWLDFVNFLVKSVVNELGAPSTAVRAELDKSLLYEPGAMVELHKVEKLPGMFGKLIICFPSKHTGGVVHLQHGDEAIKLPTAEYSEANYSFLAWYADVAHEMKPVETGYRWVLSYNLISDENSSWSSTPAPAQKFQNHNLVDSLTMWQGLDNPPDLVAYPLSHVYTSRSLSLSSLRGHDYVRARSLADSCAKHEGFRLFTANFEVCETWPNNEGSDDRSKVSLSTRLSSVCDLDGFLLSPVDVTMSKTFFLQPIITVDRKPDFRTDGVRLNKECKFRDTYENTILLLVPLEFLFVPLCGEKGDIKSVEEVLKHLQSSYSRNRTASLHQVLLHICHRVFEEEFATGAGGLNDKYLGHVAVAAAYIGDIFLFRVAGKRTRELWEDARWYDLGGLIDVEAPQVDGQDVLAALRKCIYLSRAYDAVTNFFRGFRSLNVLAEDPVKMAFTKLWYTDRLIDLFNYSPYIVGEVDAGTIVKIIMGTTVQPTPKQRDAIDKAAVDFVAHFMHDDKNKNNIKAFVNALGAEILLEITHPIGMRFEVLRKILSIMLDTAISVFDLSFWLRYLRGRRPNKGLAKFPPASRCDVIRAFYDLAAGYSDDAASRLLWKITSQAIEDKMLVSEELVPLMKELLLSVNTSSVEVQHCFQMLVKAYIAELVTEKPSKPVDWARPLEVQECPKGCDGCAKVNAFLRDPHVSGLAMNFGEDEFHVRYTFDMFDLFDVIVVNADAGQVFLAKTTRWFARSQYRWALDVGGAHNRLKDLKGLEKALGGEYDTIMATAVEQYKKLLALVAEGEGGRQDGGQLAKGAKDLKLKDNSES